MIYNAEMFWKSTIDEMKDGYKYDKARDEFICLLCGKSFLRGIIYSEDGIFYEAERYARVHVEKAHGNVFDCLLNMDRKLTGLTEVQKTLMDMFYKGHSDNEIVKILGGGSTSTIRNHRFILREKEKQAKLFLAMMELLRIKNMNEENFTSIHRTAVMVDERYNITKEETDEILKTYFKQGPDGLMTNFPRKEKRKVILLRHIAGRFSQGVKYTEKEVNEIIKTAYHDFATIRRYLVEYGYLDRKKDGSSYWVKE